MAFDAGMTAAIVSELQETIVGVKIEKIYQPSADEIVLLCRGRGGSKKLLLSASASAARVCLSELTKENPKITNSVPIPTEIEINQDYDSNLPVPDGKIFFALIQAEMIKICLFFCDVNHLKRSESVLYYRKNNGGGYL